MSRTLGGRIRQQLEASGCLYVARQNLLAPIEISNVGRADEVWLMPRAGQPETEASASLPFARASYPFNKRVAAALLQRTRSIAFIEPVAAFSDQDTCSFASFQFTDRST
jgi:hypothetical protein